MDGQILGEMNDIAEQELACIKNEMETIENMNINKGSEAGIHGKKVTIDGKELPRTEPLNLDPEVVKKLEETLTQIDRNLELILIGGTFSLCKE